MKNIKLSSIVLTLTASLGGIAAAGEKLSQPVGINTTARYAYGALGSARNSADDCRISNASSRAPPAALRRSPARATPARRPAFRRVALGKTSRGSRRWSRA